MIVNNDLRGIQAWATKTIIPDNRDAKGIRGNRLKPARIIREMKRTPFKGLTTDMRGRDLLGYAALKNFKTTTKKNDIMSSRLVNPNPRFALYPQPKIDKFKSSLDIKPSELDMLNKLKSDNGKMLIIQILKSRSIGIENLKGDPNQRARLLKAFNDLTAKYEIEYTKNNPASAYLLQEYEAQFKREVQDIYGIPYDDLNKPANTSAELQAILKAIQDNTTQLNNIFNMPPTIGDIAGGATPAIQPESDDEDIGPLTPNPAYDEKNRNIREDLLTTIIGNLEIIKDGLTREGVQYNDDMFYDYIIPRIIDAYKRNGLKPEIKTTDTREFEKIIRQGDINILQNLVPITEYLSRLPTPTQQDIGNIPRVVSSDDEGVDLVHDDEQEPEDTARGLVVGDILDLMNDIENIYVDDDVDDVESFIIPKIIQLHNTHYESKFINDTIPTFREFIRNAPIEHLKELKTTITAVKRNPPPFNAPPDYERDMGNDPFAPGKPKDDIKSFSSSSVGNGKSRGRKSRGRKSIRGRGIQKLNKSIQKLNKSITVSELRKQLKAIIN